MYFGHTLCKDRPQVAHGRGLPALYGPAPDAAKKGKSTGNHPIGKKTRASPTLSGRRPKRKPKKSTCTVGQIKESKMNQRYDRVMLTLALSDCCCCWHLIPNFTFKRSSCFLFLESSPLLKEERDICGKTLVTNV